MSKIIQESKFSLSDVAVDTSVTTNCNTISFENYGDVDATISLTSSPADTNTLSAGMTKTFGGSPDTIIRDSFDVVFGAGAGTKGVNIIKENINVIE